jgi:hypothetical protein
MAYILGSALLTRTSGTLLIFGASKEQKGLTISNT